MEIKSLKEANYFEEFLMDGVYCGFVINGKKFVDYKEIKYKYDLGEIKIIEENENGQYIIRIGNTEKGTIEIL